MPPTVAPNSQSFLFQQDLFKMDIEDCNGRSYMSGMPPVCSPHMGVGADTALWMKAESLQPWHTTSAGLNVSRSCPSVW